MTFVCCLERLGSGKHCWLNVYKISFVPNIGFRFGSSTKYVFLAANFSLGGAVIQYVKQHNDIESNSVTVTHWPKANFVSQV